MIVGLEPRPWGAIEPRRLVAGPTRGSRRICPHRKRRPAPPRQTRVGPKVLDGLLLSAYHGSRPEAGFCVRGGVGWERWASSTSESDSAASTTLLTTSGLAWSPSHANTNQVISRSIFSENDARGKAWDFTNRRPGPVSLIFSLFDDIEQPVAQHVWRYFTITSNLIQRKADQRVSLHVLL